MLMFPVCWLTFRRDKHLGLYLNVDFQEDDLSLYFDPREGDQPLPLPLLLVKERGSD